MNKNVKKNNSETIEKESESSESVSTNSILESNVDTSFFYTNDKFINSFDNIEIIEKIQSKYNNLNQQNTDAIIKKNIVYFLEDEKFVEYLLDYYNITIFDLFKIIYNQYSSIFKGPYLKKIRKTLSNKKYAKIERRKSDY